MANCEVGRYFSGWARHDSGGWSHQIAVLSCALALANTSNRTLVIPDKLIFPRGHTFSKKDERYKMNESVDLPRMSSYGIGVKIKYESEFKVVMSSLNSTFSRKYVPWVLKNPEFRNCSHLTKLRGASCHIAHRSSYYYMFNYCQKSTSLYPACIPQPLDYIQPIPPISRLIDMIAKSIHPFIHLHVRRGDKGKGIETEPPNIIHTLNKILSTTPAPSKTSIWLGTDEHSREFFMGLTNSSFIFLTLDTFRFPAEVANRTVAVNDSYTPTVGEYLQTVTRHSLYSVQVDYGMKKHAVMSVDNSDLQRHCCV